jgi:hypothetical protein
VQQVAVDKQHAGKALHGRAARSATASAPAARRPAGRHHVEDLSDRGVLRQRFHETLESGLRPELGTLRRFVAARGARPLAFAIFVAFPSAIAYAKNRPGYRAVR